MNYGKLQKMYFGFYEKMKRHTIAKHANTMLTGFTDKKFSLTQNQKKESVNWRVVFPMSMPTP